MKRKCELAKARLPEINNRAYNAAAPFLKRLRGYRNILTFEQWRTLRGQALHGDVDGAECGLGVIVRRWQETGRSD